MTTGAETRTAGWRGSADVWLDAAYDILVSRGVGQIKIGAMAAALGLSRTSFYWHFPDREALLDALVRRWQEKNTGNLVRQSELWAATIAEAVLNVFDCWISPELFDARLDFAIRNWAQSSPPLKQAVAATDAARLAALTAMFARHGHDPEESDVRARTLYLTQVGYISMATVEPLPDRLARMPAYVATFTGRAPTSEDVERFASRHRHRAGLSGSGGRSRGAS
ncbi:TetR/AcrR family transcriptional regulator [Roseisalinus antarcticus]|uniref:Bacterial regulatory proteins, tetR family n=1 Tax=Roseisalinus antarcticus TaxID=254357 RepID=A0A1Y5RZS4_9RHOB|nr:TetR/AcrR family transcriptional regulator [Roseisalinus antarcticus]SLN28705.1 Bacterial regulatory proteins, tetR family [Roseisalinus antarcticus]